MKKTYINEKFPHFIHGGDYNPEQWIDYEGIWDKDMELMKKANLNEMTVGIFSWAVLEPEDGVYDFSFLDTIIDKVYKNGGRIVLATPSGARPHWMSDKYPEVLRVNANDERMEFGARHNHCFTSPVYRRKITEMNRRLAERYGKHPAVIAWHISNEYGGACYCPLCREAFRDFLRERYDNDINKLNHAYWTTFWSHKFQSFDQIDPPMVRGEQGTHGLNIDWRRFITAQTKDFMKTEIAPIKEICPELPVTINMMPEFEVLNYTEFADSIDVASWDSYPAWHKRGRLDDHLLEAYRAAFWHDYFRTMKQRPFMLMESAPGSVNWRDINHLKRKGMDRLDSLQAVAHGSDSVQYFQFRKGRGSSEKFHGAVVDHVGSDETRVFKAVTSTGKTLQSIDEIAGTMPKAKVALIYDWENRWAIDGAQGFILANKGYHGTCYDYYRYFWERGISVDIIGAHGDYSKYDLIIAPMLHMTDRLTIEKIESFVKNGGSFYATYLFGMVNDTDLCYLGGFPAEELKDVFGIWNEETDALYPEQRYSVSSDMGSFMAKDLAEGVHPRGAKVLATYEGDLFDGLAAMTVNEYGSGKAYYQSFRDMGDFKDIQLDRITKELGIKGALDVDMPRGVTAHARFDGEIKYVFVENYLPEAVDMALDGEYLDLESGEKVSGVSLSAFDVKILKQ